jgi:hypothetical protein
MSRHPIKTQIDLSNAADKQRLIRSIEAATGVYEVDIVPVNGSIAEVQRRYYWKVIVGSLVDYLNEQEYLLVDKDSVHVYLRDNFGGKSTTEMDSVEFTDFIERVRDWMAHAIGIVTPAPARM